MSTMNVGDPRASQPVESRGSGQVPSSPLKKCSCQGMLRFVPGRLRRNAGDMGYRRFGGAEMAQIGAQSYLLAGASDFFKGLLRLFSSEGLRDDGGNSASLFDLTSWPC